MPSFRRILLAAAAAPLALALAACGDSADDAAPTGEPLAPIAATAGASWVETAYRMALSRSPNTQERRQGVQALAELRRQWQRSAAGTQDAGGENADRQSGNPGQADRQALTTFCHMILNSAEFLYVD